MHGYKFVLHAKIASEIHIGDVRKSAKYVNAIITAVDASNSRLSIVIFLRVGLLNLRQAWDVNTQFHSYTY